jgi:hypothetical protein
MISENRIIYSNGGTLTDYSKELNDLYAQPVTLTITSDDYMYIGGPLPFNHRYVEVSTANANAGSISVDLWNGSEWKAAIDVLDYTSVSGKTLAQSGLIAWTPDWDVSNWSYDDTDEMTSSGLSTGPKIGAFYWARLSVSADTSATVLKYIYFKFSEDADLVIQYPEFNNSSLKTAFAAGKSDWKDQAVAASEYILRDLRAMNVMVSPNQILDWQLFKMASIHKTAELIYTAFGDDYTDDKTEARKAYQQALQLKFFNLDSNKDATLDPKERRALSTFVTR